MIKKLGFYSVNAFCLSLVFHGLIAVLSMKLGIFESSSIATPPLSASRFEVDLIKDRSSALPKLRKWGEKDGVKRSSTPAFDLSKLQVEPLKTKDMISVNNKSVPLRPLIEQEQTSTKRRTRYPKAELSLYETNPFHSRLKEDLKVMREKAASSSSILGHTNLDIQLIAPKGTSLDKLNAVELKFYSFQKRSAETFIASIIKAFNDYKVSYPHIDLYRAGKGERLRGKLIFDEKGNVVSIKFLEGSRSKPVQSFFENVLQGINALPNPPRFFISSGKFEMNYILSFEG